MHLLITGGTGFIGQHLCKQLGRGTEITVLSRQSEHLVKRRCGDHVTAISSLDHIAPHTHIDAIVNLAGAPIADARWSTQRKRMLEESRTEITRKLVTLISDLDHKPNVFISGSAVGFYGDQGASLVTETTTPHPEYTHELCAKWESCAQLAEPYTRICYLRTGLVLGNDGGFLKRLILPFKLGLGTQLGDGRHYMPWVHVNDMVAIIQFLLEHPTVTGPVNAVSPNPETNKVFTQSLANALHRPVLLRTPASVLRLALGEMSRLLLTGQRAVPQKLLEAGFQFSFKELDPALEDLFP